MDLTQIPQDIAANLVQCWPDGVVSEFDASESYFHDVYNDVRAGLDGINWASLLWETDGQPEPDDAPFQAHYIFFLAPNGAEFLSETSSTAVVEGDPGQGDIETVVRGHAWVGCAVGISVVAPYAVLNLCSHSQFEDGSQVPPEVETFIVDDQTNERIDTNQYFLDSMGEDAYRVLDELRGAIADVLARNGIQVLDDSVLDLPVPGLAPDEAVSLEEPLRVRDAFFFYGG